MRDFKLLFRTGDQLLVTRFHALHPSINKGRIVTFASQLSPPLESVLCNLR